MDKVLKSFKNTSKFNSTLAMFWINITIFTGETGRGKRKRKPKPVEDIEPEEKKESPKSDLAEMMGEDNKDFYDVVEMAAKFQPTGNTLDTTSVKTPVPFLLKHTLREYQHIGLDW